MIRTTELLFLVEEDVEGGYVAHCLQAAIFTQADDLETLQANVKEAVECHFDEGRPTRLMLGKHS